MDLLSMWVHHAEWLEIAPGAGRRADRRSGRVGEQHAEAPPEAMLLPISLWPKSNGIESRGGLQPGGPSILDLRAASKAFQLHHQAQKAGRGLSREVLGAEHKRDE